MHPHFPRKRFGQHFLSDKSVINHIVDAFNPKSTEHVVEIGSGLGALTTELLLRVGHLEVVELDRDLIPILIERCKHLGELIVHQADALRFDFASLANKPDSLRIIGNLPYNITTPLLFHLLDSMTFIHDMLFMLQKEVVERMVAHPGEHAYGRLSVMVQYFCQANILFTVDRHCFVPPPKVESAIIHLLPYHKLPYPAQDFELLANIVRLAFNQRRKTIRKSLYPLVSEQDLIKLNLNPELRAERLSVEDFVTIANYKAHESQSKNAKT